MSEHFGQMNAPASHAPLGHVASLHLHPRESGTPFQSVKAVELVAAKGIVDDQRFFGRVSRSSGEPSRRQVSLIEREQIAEHAAALGLEGIPPGAARANVETEGINLVALVGRHIQVGSAMLYLYEPRKPCPKMDLVCQGLQARMSNGRQGVMAEVVRSGSIRCGDAITVLENGATADGPGATTPRAS